jgi:plastocyanin
MTTRAARSSRRVLLALSGPLVAAALLCSGTAGAATTRTVTLKNIDFSPEILRVSKGSTVTFAFRDGDTVHNVTSTGSRRFTTIANRTSGSRSRTFTRAGTYRYACTLHPGMTGRIVVR